MIAYINHSVLQKMNKRKSRVCRLVAYLHTYIPELNEFVKSCCLSAHVAHAPTSQSKDNFQNSAIDRLSLRQVIITPGCPIRQQVGNSFTKKKQQKNGDVFLRSMFGIQKCTDNSDLKKSQFVSFGEILDQLKPSLIPLY